MVPAPTKTPLFQAIHALRYQRQAMIRQIETATGRHLICYIAGISASVERDDIVGFVDLLHNLSASSYADLLLHTGQRHGL